MVSLVQEFADLRGYRGFDFIMADPPWRFETYSAKGKGKSPEQHYECQSLEWVKQLPVPVIAADHCVLWLWTMHAMIPQALEVMEAWGFAFKTSGAWVKYNPKTGKRAFGTGYLLRGASEPFLIGTRGKPKTSRSARTAIVCPKTKIHSEKPHDAYREAEILMPDANRIELFSRKDRPGWTVWGNETGKLNPKAALAAE